jgi:phage antirepressor YoqD-like protein
MSEYMTVKEVAVLLDVTPEAIKKHVRELYPEKMTNGKATLLNEEEITAIKQKMIPTTSVVAVQTELEMQQKVVEVMSWMKTKIINLQKENETMKPKALFYDQVTQSDQWHDMSEVAKLLNLKIGRNKIYRLLRDKGVLKKNNQPYQQFCDHGYFRLVEREYIQNNEVKISTKTVVSQKGIDYILKTIKRND